MWHEQLFETRHNHVDTFT